MSDVDKSKLDPATVAALYVEHAEELRRFLIGVLRDTSLAGDVLQATFVKLVERGADTQEKTRKSWLFRVAYHEAMAVRRRQAIGNKVVRRVAWTKKDSEHGADDPLVRFEAVEQLRAALGHLSAEQRQVVTMRIYEEKKFAEIAEELQIPLGTALGRMRTALAKLRGLLGEFE